MLDIKIKLFLIFYATLVHGNVVKTDEVIPLQQKDDLKTVAPKGELVLIDGVPYFIGSTEMIYNDALNFCNSMSMTLVSLETEEKNNAIYNFLWNNGTSTRDFWTSGYRYESDSSFFWTSRSEFFTYTNWATNQPEDNENCVYLRVHSTTTTWPDGWHDARCNTDLTQFICEYPCQLAEKHSKYNSF